MSQAHVPQFGKWDQGGEVPYTQYFENARKGKKAGSLFNPNDPDANPEAFSQDAPAALAPAYRPTDEHHGNITRQKPSAGSVQHQAPPRMKSPMDKRVPAEGHANQQRRQGTKPGPTEMQDKAATVPQFGEWEKDEEFTDIFDQYKRERKTGVVSPVRTKKNDSTQRKKNSTSFLAKIRSCFGRN